MKVISAHLLAMILCTVIGFVAADNCWCGSTSPQSWNGCTNKLPAYLWAMQVSDWPNYCPQLNDHNNAQICCDDCSTLFFFFSFFSFFFSYMTTLASCYADRFACEAYWNGKGE
jgi:hypothetical protein